MPSPFFSTDAGRRSSSFFVRSFVCRRCFDGERRSSRVMDRTNEPQRIGPVTSITPPRVLVVDDESTIRIALRRFFTRMGWEVEEAGDGDRALEMIIEDRSQRVIPPYSLV